MCLFNYGAKQIQWGFENQTRSVFGWFIVVRFQSQPFGNRTFKMASLAKVILLYTVYYNLRRLIPEVVRYPHFKVPYPISNGDNNSQARQWQLSIPTVTCMVILCVQQTLGCFYSFSTPSCIPKKHSLPHYISVFFQSIFFTAFSGVTSLRLGPMTDP